MEQQAADYSFRILEQWGAYGLVLLIAALIVKWLLEHIKQQRTAFYAVIAQKDKELEQEREYSRHVAEQFRDSTLQIVTTLQTATSAVERIREAVDESRRIVQRCKGRSDGN